MSGKSFPVRTVLFLGFLLVGGMLLAGALLARNSEQWRAWQFFPDMADSPAFRAQEPNPDLPQGTTHQAPPEGAIARGYIPMEFSADEAGAIQAGERLMNPVAVHSESAQERGRQQFGIFCASCHGMDALGKGPVVQRGFPPPPSLIGGNVEAWPDGRLFHVMTYGIGTMPGHAHQITRKDRWNIVVYLRAIQEQPEPEVLEPPTEPAPEAAEEVDAEPEAPVEPFADGAEEPAAEESPAPEPEPAQPDHQEGA